MTPQRLTTIYAPVDPGSVPDDQANPIDFNFSGPVVIACDLSGRSEPFPLDGAYSSIVSANLTDEFLEPRSPGDKIVATVQLDDSELAAVLIADAKVIVTCSDQQQLERVSPYASTADLIWLGDADSEERMKALAAQGWRSVTCIDPAAELFCGLISFS